MNFHIVPPPLPEEFKWLFPEKMKLPVDGSIAKEAAAESMREFIYPRLLRAIRERNLDSVADYTYQALIQAQTHFSWYRAALNHDFMRKNAEIIWPLIFAKIRKNNDSDFELRLKAIWEFAMK